MLQDIHLNNLCFYDYIALYYFCCFLTYPYYLLHILDYYCIYFVAAKTVHCYRMDSNYYCTGPNYMDHIVDPSYYFDYP